MLIGNAKAKAETANWTVFFSFGISESPSFLEVVGYLHETELDPAAGGGGPGLREAKAPLFGGSLSTCGTNSLFWRKPLFFLGNGLTGSQEMGNGLFPRDKANAKGKQ